MNINIIVATSRDHVIGKDNTIPWRCPSDLKRFKKLTKGHHILMGRKTFESLPGILPLRTHLIVTRQIDVFGQNNEQTIYFNSILDAINYARENNEEELFIIGGGEIYNLCKNICNKVYLTVIDCEVTDGDTWFKFNDEDFVLKSKEFIIKDDSGDDYDSNFYIYERI